MQRPLRDVVTANAHAKVNLALSVGPPIPAGAHAGYHPLCGLSTCLGLSDQITLARAQTTSLEIAWANDAPSPSPIDWSPESDLCWRAISVLEDETRRELPTAISVLKRIPVGGGLGGGSSDAATTLLLACQLHGLELEHDRLAHIAEQLGADVPYFIDPGTHSTAPRPAIVAGVGERCERLEPIRGELLLMLPSFGCPTPDVYRAYDQSPVLLNERAVREIATRAAREGLKSVDRDLFNDLTQPATSVKTELSEIIARAESATSSPIHMSGSGSTLFAVSSAPELDPERLRAELGVACLRTPLV